MATSVIQNDVGARVSAGVRQSDSLAASRARWPTVSIETDGATYVGQVCVPETRRRLTDALADDRPFLHLVHVSINGGDEREPFIALSKRYIRTVRILDEGKPLDLMLLDLAL